MFEAIINDAFGDVNDTTVEESIVDPEDVKKTAALLKVSVDRLTTNGVLGKIRRLVNKNQKSDGHDFHSADIDKYTFVSGDEEIVERLQQFQEQKNGAPLTWDDIKTALGPEASKVMVDRIMERFDEDKSGTIELNELVDSEGNLRNLYLSKEELEEKRRKEEAQRKQQATQDKSRKQLFAERLFALEQKFKVVVSLFEKLNK